MQSFDRDSSSRDSSIIDVNRSMIEYIKRTDGGEKLAGYLGTRVAQLRRGIDRNLGPEVQELQIAVLRVYIPEVKRVLQDPQLASVYDQARRAIAASR